ncbi:MAG: coat protein, partial [Desulfobacterales bacterium]|nr:coat protein [Desulfobacterales bacterium]
MSKTQIADVIVPSVFAPYMINTTAEKSAFLGSGIISPMDQSVMNEMIAKGKRGGLINMPYWNDLVGDDEVLSDTNSLSPAKMDAGQDIAIMLMRGKAWEFNDLAGALAGSDPMKAIGDLVANYWARMYQKALISMLTGVFGA